MRRWLGALRARLAIPGRPAADRPNSPGEKPDVGFVACIEGGLLEAQTLLLFESIRRYTGRFSECTLYALSPRAGHGISREARRRLDDLGVTYVDTLLNTECPEYGSANRVAAAAYVEGLGRHKTLVVLDSDTLFLGEPSAFILPPDVDVAVRPVDGRNMSTAGDGDPFDRYWRGLCRCCGVEYDAIPWRESFVVKARIKANYNGGLVVVRADLGILRRWSDFFFKSVREGLRPRPDAPAFQAGAGWVEPAAASLWGSNQAALSLAIWSTTRRVQELPPTYNYPLHLHDRMDPDVLKRAFPHLLHVHYHWLFSEETAATNPLFCADGPLSDEQRAWLGSAIPLAATTGAVDSAEMTICFCTLAVHAPYRRRAHQLCASAMTVPWVVLTDEPADFAALPVRAIRHVPTGPMAVDYLARLPPTGQNRGAAAYHDKRFALLAALDGYDTALYVDADSLVSELPSLSAFPTGIAVLPVVTWSIAEHLKTAGPWRLPHFEELARRLTGSTDILREARWCHEALIAVTKDGRESRFFSAWAVGAEFLQSRDVYSGEGGVIGLAAAYAGWTVDFDALTDLAAAIEHEGGGPKLT